MAAHFVAFLTGTEEVPPVQTSATGEANFMISDNQIEISYQLTVNNIQAVTAAHIHLGARGVNGPVIVTLFMSRPNMTITNGVVRGVIRQRDLVGPMQNMPLADLIRQMVNRNTYVNVHTVRHPDGEIRGQIRRAENR